MILALLSVISLLVTIPCLGFALLPEAKANNRYTEFTYYFAGGTLLNCIIVLLLGNLSYATCIIYLIVLVGLWFKRRQLATWNKIDHIKLGLTLIPIAHYFSRVVCHPIFNWDSRSIWFFHAKIIHFAGNIHIKETWADPLIAFSHTDYPKLLAILSSQITHLAGFWNEYLPKTSILFLLLITTLGFLSLAHKRVSYLFFVIAIMKIAKVHLHTGYMDSYVALFSAIAILAIINWQETKSLASLLISLQFCGLALFSKNEGTLFACAYFVVTALYLFPLLKKKMIPIIVAGAIPFLPFCIWGIYKGLGGIGNDLELGESSFSIILKNISDWSIVSYVFTCFWKESTLSTTLPLILILSLPLLFLKRFPLKSFLTSFLIFSLYSTGLIIIYFASPYGVKWHVPASITRTILTVNVLSWIPVVVLLMPLEEKIANAIKSLSKSKVIDC